MKEIEWKKKLTTEQYRVLREKGTESPFSSEFVELNKKGIYKCAACGNVLFDSSTKFDSHCGWPSFWDAKKESVELHKDNSWGMDRTEVMCKKCGGHLGHIFGDGPIEHGGKRFCINGASLSFSSKEKSKKSK